MYRLCDQCQLGGGGLRSSAQQSAGQRAGSVMRATHLGVDGHQQPAVALQAAHTACSARTQQLWRPYSDWHSHDTCNNRSYKPTTPQCF